MKWIEIIALRSATDVLARLDTKSLLSINDNYQAADLDKIKVYRHCTMDTDLSVHLYWDSDKVDPTGSSLAQHLKQLLKENGLINHSIWVEEAVNNSKNKVMAC